MITGLILVGLIIDLGGAPNHHRLGFQVCIDIDSNRVAILILNAVLEKPRCLRGSWSRAK